MKKYYAASRRPRQARGQKKIAFSAEDAGKPERTLRAWSFPQGNVSMINIREYELLTLETGAYRDIELDILKETLAAWKQSPGSPYELIELRDGRVLAGFCLYYHSPNTEHTYDIHTFVVGRDYRNKAVGPRLLELLLDAVLDKVDYAVIRVETSRLKEDAVGDSFYSDNGFQAIGHIPGFYDNENDYYIYVKSVSAENDEDTLDDETNDETGGDTDAASPDGDVRSSEKTV